MRAFSKANHRSLMSAAHAAGYAMAVTEPSPLDEESHALEEAARATAAALPRPTTAIVPYRPETARLSALRDWLSSFAFGRAMA
jgi:hypothetical protein